MSSDEEYLYNRLSYVVNRTQIPYAEIARRAGIQKQVVTKVIHGHVDGKLSTWSKILRACDLSIASIISDEVYGKAPRKKAG